jgi:hypothetical protein
VAIRDTVNEETIMDELKSEVEIPSVLPLDGLCAGAHHELLMRGYGRRMVNRYMFVWQHLAEFVLRARRT